MKKRDLILSLGLAAALFASAPALRAQTPSSGAEHASPGDHGQDRGLDRETAPAAAKPRAIHEAQPELKQAKPEAEPASHGHEVELFGFAFGSLGQWILQLINLALFGGALWYLVKGPVKAAFANLKRDLEDRLAQAEKDKAEGEAQIKELEAKMAGLQAELNEILAKSGVEAEAEKQRVLAAARTEAAAILAAAESEITRQQQLASQELRALVAELAVEAAAKRLEARVQGATAQSVTDHAIAELGGSK
jgi:F-type H+-transporting ATPase subunit b